MPFTITGFRTDDETLPPEPATRSLTGPGSTDQAAPPLIGNQPVVSALPAAGKGLALNAAGKVPQSATLLPFVTWADGDTTPSVFGGKVFKTANTGATSITFFDDAMEGQEITIVFTDANTTVVDGANMNLAGNLTSTANDVLHLIYDGSSWYEISRSVN